MPYLELQFTLRTRGPVLFADTPGTRFRGALGAALVNSCCKRHTDGGANCEVDDKRDGKLQCSLPDCCPAALFYKPVDGLFKDLPPPMTLRSAEFEGLMWHGECQFCLTVFGSRAVASAKELVSAVSEMASQGIDNGLREAVRMDVVAFSASRFRTIAERATEYLASWEKRNRPDILVEFATTLVHRVQGHGDFAGQELRQGRPVLRWFSGATGEIREQPAPGTGCGSWRKDFLLHLFKNFGGAMVRWDLYQRFRAGDLAGDALKERLRTWEKKGCNAAQNLDIRRASLSAAEHRTRFSVELGGLKPKKVVNLRGTRGHVLLTGDLAPAIPWLVAMEVCGVGAMHSWGCGEVRLWMPA